MCLLGAQPSRWIWGEWGDFERGFTDAQRPSSKQRPHVSHLRGARRPAGPSPTSLPLIPKVGGAIVLLSRNTQTAHPARRSRRSGATASWMRAQPCNRRRRLPPRHGGAPIDPMACPLNLFLNPGTLGMATANGARKKGRRIALPSGLLQRAILRTVPFPPTSNCAPSSAYPSLPSAFLRMSPFRTNTDTFQILSLRRLQAVDGSVPFFSPKKQNVR